LYRFLKRRALFGLRPGSYSDRMPRHIAHIVEGTARSAIQILRNAALNADSESSETIKLRHVTAGHNEAEELKKSFLPNRLNSHQRLL
jgi:Cdc6-like AAA superfamily ATPase